MDTNSRMQIADKAMKSFIARYFRDDEDGTGMITGEFYWAEGGDHGSCHGAG